MKNRKMHKHSEKNMKLAKKHKKMKRRSIATFISIVSITISVCTLYYTKNENHRKEMLLEPRFTINKSIEENGDIYWQIINTGGTINNVDIYPMMYLELNFLNTDNDEISTVKLYLMNYFSEECYHYNVSDNTFYVNDYQQNSLQVFASQFAGIANENGYIYSDFSTEMCFVLNYNNYEGKNFNKVYTLTDNIVEKNPEDIISYRANQLEDIGKIPEYDVCTPMEYSDKCVISANYKDAETREYIDSQEKYKAYLYLIILGFIDGNDKTIDDMMGSLILMKDGTLYYRECELEVCDE